MEISFILIQLKNRIHYLSKQQGDLMDILFEVCSDVPIIKWLAIINGILVVAISVVKFLKLLSGDGKRSSSRLYRNYPKKTYNLPAVSQTWQNNKWRNTMYKRR